MSRKHSPIVLPEPRIIYVSAEYRVTERAAVTLTTRDNLPLAFALEWVLERNTPDAVKSPAWLFVDTEAGLCSESVYSLGGHAHIGWRAFFSVIRSIPRSAGV